jgi:putative transposase
MCVNISIALGSFSCVDGDALPEKSAIKEVESEPEGDGRMKRSRYTAEQIIGILKEQEARTPVAELRRKHGMSDATFYNWKSKREETRSPRRSGCGLRRSVSVRRADRLPVGTSTRLPSQAIDFGFTFIVKQSDRSPLWITFVLPHMIRYV